MIYEVEDNESIRDLVVYTLSQSGYEVEGIPDGKTLWEKIKINVPDLILLDLMLPDEDGMSILSKLKQQPQYKNIPVIIVSAKDRELDKIRGLDSGADDYITKPYSMMELISRVNVQIRRKTHDRENDFSDVFNIGDLNVNVGLREVRIKNELIPLTYKEFELLVTFLSHPNKIYTRDDLLNKIWGIDIEIETRTIDVHIRTLRSKLREYGDLIKTVRHVGYRLGELST
ncbi:MAG: response regulator [Succinivibrionaceae bacterium]